MFLDGKTSLPNISYYHLNTQQNVYTTLVWDNTDRLEETLSGKGTPHRVNGIAVQEGIYYPQEIGKINSVERTKRRSIKQYIH